jgi:large subunit ribosomal protein L6
MSRIGKKPIVIPDGVNVEIADGRVTVSKGQESLSQEILPGITVTIEDSKVLVGREDDTRQTRALHGLTRSLINNMVVGLHEGFTKNLEIHGVGFGLPKDFVRMSLMPANSQTARTAPPAITPVPALAGFNRTRAAPKRPVTW